MSKEQFDNCFNCCCSINNKRRKAADKSRKYHELLESEKREGCAVYIPIATE